MARSAGRVMLATLAIAAHFGAAAACTGLDGLSGGDDTPIAPKPDATAIEPSIDAGGCAPGMADCDGDPSNGCETNTLESPSHCGFCANACPARANGYPVCAAGSCRVGCNDGFGNCDADDSNGCEKPVSTDPLNCGTCSHDCLGATCSAGVCEPVQLAANQTAATSIAVDAAYVYWGAKDLTRLNGKSPGSLTTLVPGAGPSALLVDDVYLYWLSTSDGVVRRCNRTATCTNREAIPPPALSHTRSSLAIDSARVFYGVNTTVSTGFVEGVPKNAFSSGVNDAGIEAGFPEGGVADTTMSGLGVVLSLAVDTNMIYAGSAQGVVARGASSGKVAKPTAVTTQQQSGGILAMALTSDRLFWSVPSGVYSCPKPGCATPTTVGKGVSSPVAMAIDGSFLYWCSEGTQGNGYSDGAVYRCPLDGCIGAPVKIATGQGRPRAIAVDGTHVYWANQTAATIMKVAK